MSVLCLSACLFVCLFVCLSVYLAITNQHVLLCCSSAPALVSANNQELSFEVVVKNKKENAYNTQVIATYSGNLFYSSVFPPVSKKCSIDKKP